MSETALTAIAVASLIRSIQEISSELRRTNEQWKQLSDLKRIQEQLKSIERAIEKQGR